MLYWKNMRYAVREYGLNWKKYNLSRALRNCGAARSAATAGHLTPPQSSWRCLLMINT